MEGLYAYIGIWLHSHKKWGYHHQRNLRVGMPYGVTHNSTITATPTRGGDTPPPHRTVTTTFMGLANDNPIWDHMHKDRTHHIMYNVRTTEDTNHCKTFYSKTRVSYHEEMGLIDVAKQLHQLWHEGYTIVAARFCLVGMAFFGELRHRVAARWNGIGNLRCRLYVIESLGGDTTPGNISYSTEPVRYRSVPIVGDVS